MACQSVELGQTCPSSVEDGGLGLDNMRATVEREEVVGFECRGDDVGGDNPSAVNRFFTVTVPVRVFQPSSCVSM